MACADGENDRLSNLSDELICHILSFLSTKLAYRTSVLSTRWTSIGSKILDLHFKLPNLSDNSVLSKETQSVYAALLRRKENIRKLTLNGDFCCQTHDVHMWISKALDLNVQELHLKLTLERPTVLPLRLSTSESLVVLKLDGRIQFRLDWSSSVYFPSLKILHLKGIVLHCICEYNSEIDLGFLSGCPRLEEFLITDFFKQGLDITFPLLKRLYLDLVMFDSLYPVLINMGPFKINLLSSLEILDIVDSSARKYEFVNFPNVDRATLCISRHPVCDNNLYTLLKGLSNVKSLTLEPETIALLSMENNLDKLSLLTFNNLLFLSFEMLESCNWNMLVRFLQSTPNLKDLSIKKLIESKDGNSGWEEPSVTPTCLTSSLITFKFQGIQNIKAEFDFTRYIIEHSSKLEKVKILTQEKTSLVETNLLKGLKKKSSLLLVLEATKD